MLHVPHINHKFELPLTWIYFMIVVWQLQPLPSHWAVLQRVWVATPAQVTSLVASAWLGHCQEVSLESIVPGSGYSHPRVQHSHLTCWSSEAHSKRGWQWQGLSSVQGSYCRNHTIQWTFSPFSLLYTSCSWCSLMPLGTIPHPSCVWYSNPHHHLLGDGHEGFTILDQFIPRMGLSAFSSLRSHTETCSANIKRSAPVCLRGTSL